MTPAPWYDGGVLSNTYDFHSARWYGLKVGRWSASGALAQSHRRFNRRDTASQGLGLLQIGARHLFYLGTVDGRLRLCLGFVWLAGGPS